MEEVANFEGMIRSFVYKFKDTHKLTNHLNNNDDDLIQEGRIAAWKAIKGYREGKGTKLSTYVYECIKNRFKDLQRTANRRVHLHSPFEGCDDDGDYDRYFETNSEGYQFDDMIEQELEAQIKLTPFEYHVYTKLLAGHRRSDIVRERCRNNNIGEYQSKKEVNECFSRISQKLNLTGTNLKH